MPDAFSSHPVSLPADMLLASCDRLALLLFLRPVPARRAAGLAQLPGLLLPPTLGGLGGSLLGEGGMTGRLGSEVSAPPLPGSLLSTSFLLDLEWSSTPLWRLLLFVLLSLVLLSLSLSIPKGRIQLPRTWSKMERPQSSNPRTSSKSTLFTKEC